MCIRDRCLGFVYLYNELSQNREITDAQREFARNGERRKFWESRLNSGDPIAGLALEILDICGVGQHCK